MISLIRRLISWVTGLFSTNEPSYSGVDVPRKSIVPLLIYPLELDGLSLSRETVLNSEKYFMSSPIEVTRDKVKTALETAELWLNDVLGATITWERLRRIDSSTSISQWRSRKIGLLREEVQQARLPWNEDYIYLAFVRGMGGYAGGIKYETGQSGYAMVGDICLEAICEYPEPNAGSILLGSNWPVNARSVQGQSAAFIHEALHGLDLPHPDGWPEEDRPLWDERRLWVIGGTCLVSLPLKV